MQPDWVEKIYQEHKAAHRRGPHSPEEAKMNQPQQPPISKLGDAFDGAVRSLDGRPGVTRTKPSTLRSVHQILGTSQTFIVQTYRDEEAGDTILVEYVGAEGVYRLALPPNVADTIARQRDALVTKSRRAGAAKAVVTRAERGIEPGFLKARRKSK